MNLVSSKPMSSKLKNVIWNNTQVNVVKFKYTWTISNFRPCHDDDDIYFSPDFYVNDKYMCNLRLGLAERENKDGIHEVLQMCLNLRVTSDTQVQVAHQFSILNIKEEKTTIFKPKVNSYSKNGNWGKPEFLNARIILNKVNGYLPNDELTIVCEISVKENIVDKSGRINTVRFKVPECSFINNLQDLFETQKFNDITLLVNGQELKAHKNILSARSPVFAAMFEYEMKESIHNCITITDVDYEVLREMLRFIYTGQTTKLECLAENLLAAADKYGLERLKVLCEEAVYKNVSINSVAEILILADLHSAKQLEVQTIDFIKIHWTDVKNTIGWKNMRSHPHLIEAVFDTLFK